MAGISINEAYNHFASTYVAKENANVDKHKKSELQNVYKSIAKINKKSPLHVLKQDDNAQAEAVGIKERARFLKSQLESIGNEENTTLGKKSAVSSQPDNVTVEYVGKHQSNTTEFNIEVSNLATNQINAGHFLKPDEPVDLPIGSYAFNVGINGHDYEFQYSIREGNTNHDIQAKLSRLINKAGIGLIAGMQSDDEGKTTLIIGSSDTGVKPGQNLRFEITESKASENPHSVSYFGLNLIAQEPVNARFSLNGTEHTSSSNRFTVGNEFDITLKAATAPGEPVTIGVQNESDTLVENVRSLIDGYNNFLDSADNIQSTGFKNTRLVSETKAIAENHIKGIEDYGVSLNENSRINYDPQRLRDKSASGPPKGLVVPLQKFAKALQEKTDEISLDPMKYVERPVFNYKDPHGGETPSPYITSEYSGMMFNNYC